MLYEQERGFRGSISAASGPVHQAQIECFPSLPKYNTLEVRVYRQGSEYGSPTCTCINTMVNSDYFENLV